MVDREPDSPDFATVCADPRTLLDELAYGSAVTDSVINTMLRISKNREFMTVFKFDRIARSAARSRKEFIPLPASS